MAVRCGAGRDEPRDPGAAWRGCSGFVKFWSPDLCLARARSLVAARPHLLVGEGGGAKPCVIRDDGIVTGDDERAACLWRPQSRAARRCDGFGVDDDLVPVVAPRSIAGLCLDVQEPAAPGMVITDDHSVVPDDARFHPTPPPTASMETRAQRGTPRISGAIGLHPDSAPSMQSADDLQPRARNALTIIRDAGLRLSV